jgi:Ca2+-binding EF-hand superfamily protein
MYISLILALAAPLSPGMVEAPQQRGLVSTVSASADANVGTYHFTMRGSNPCGAVRLDYGDGTEAITHPILNLPVTIAYEYARTGNFIVRAEGMGNCDGVAQTRVEVTRVRPRPEPVTPPADPEPQRGRGNQRIRFAEMDTNGDNIITRQEWRGSARSFEVHDWNNDGRLSGDEVRMGAAWPNRGADVNDWTEARFNTIDRNGDGRITRTEWGYDLQDFIRVDRNRDNIVTRNEFLIAQDIDDDRGDSFENLDINGDNRIDRNEWHGSLAAFRWLDQNGDGRLSRVETAGADLPAGGTGTGAPNRIGGRRDTPRTVIVSAQRAWADTGIDLQPGDIVTITATGRVNYSAARDAVAEPGGAAGRAATAAAPMPHMDIGTLIARIGNSEPFVVGANLDSLRAPRAGRLFLGVNDDVLTDNSGQFQASITVIRR